MIDVSTILRTAYFTRLNGAVTLNSAAVPVYDKVIATATEPYIQIGDFTDVENSTKNSYSHEVTQTLVIKTKYLGDTGGKKDSDSIANQITVLVRTRTPMSIGTTAHIITTTLDNTNSFEQQVEGGVLVIRVLRFRHIISETGLDR